MNLNEKIFFIILILLFSLLLLYLIVFIYISNYKIDYDIIIVGSGLAGLTSTYEIYKLLPSNSKILLIEKEHSFGGNSIKATSGINLLNTLIQISNNISDKYDIFYNDTYKSSKNLSDPNLIKTLIIHSHFLEKDFFNKINLNLSELSLLGGHSLPRTHRPKNITVGYYITSSIYNLLYKLNNKKLTIKFNATLIELTYNKKKNKINGIKYFDKKLDQIVYVKTKAVILCTGGFGYDFNNSNNDSLIYEFAKNLTNFPTTSGKGSIGSGMKIARKIGAKLIDMNYIQIHPTSFVDLKDEFNKHKFLAPELLRGKGGILINNKGERFCNELGYRDYVTEKIIKNCDKKINNNNIEQYECFLILDKKGFDDYGKDINYYISKNLIKKYKNFKDFSNKFNINYTNLNKTIFDYNECYNNNKTDNFDKKYFYTNFDMNKTIYVSVITPSIHYTMGGIKINNRTEVIDANNKIIKGLYAVGEVTGGVHGANRLGGNSLLECVVFGRIAAINSYNYIKNK